MSSLHTSTCSYSVFVRASEWRFYRPRLRQFSFTPRRQRKHVDHYATLAVPRNATVAQIKTSYYQLSKKYHPDVAKDNASRTKFHAVSEAYAILGDDRKRREFDRSLDSFFQSCHAPGQHSQATTVRPSQQPGFKHLWPNHPRNRTRGPTGGHPHPSRHDHLYRSQADAQTSRTDPFTNPFVQRATGHRRNSAPGSGTASQSSSSQSHFQQGGLHGARPTPWTTSGDERRHGSATNDRPTHDEAAAESGMMRALGASGLVGVIMLIAAIGGDSRRT